jgi:hypothetical protein
VTEREEFEAWALTDGGYTRKDLELFNGQYIDEHANTALDAWQAARRTTPDREAIIAAAEVVVREALDSVTVHPCDEHNDDVRADHVVGPMRALYLALKTAPNGEKG